MSKHKAMGSGIHLPVNQYTGTEGQSLVGLLSTDLAVGAAAEGLLAKITQAVELIGGIGRTIKPGDSVLIKPNFNSPDPMPASADVEFVAAVVALLRQAGVSELAVGESSGLPWHPTSCVLEQTGLLRRMEQLDVPVIVFDDAEWVDVDLAALGAKYLASVRVPAALDEYDKLVFLPNLKTHRLARFTMSLKLSVGLMHPDERKALHAADLEEKTAELALAVRPDLIILDGRLAFVTLGPAKGELVSPGVIMTGGDQVSLDVEAIKILQGYQADNRLTGDAWSLPQIAAAAAHGIGPGAGRSYSVVRG